MKNLGLLAFFFVYSCSVLLSQTVSDVIVFKERIFNFGEILEKKGKVSHSFVFLNKKRSPIVINGISVGCRCVSADYPKAPVKSGGREKITVMFNPAYHSGFFSKEIVVLSNNGKNYNRIWIQGNVIPFDHPVEEEYPYSFGKGLYLNLQVLVFGEMKKRTSNSTKLKYANNSKKPMTLTFLIDKKSNDIRITNPGKIKPGARGEVSVTYMNRANRSGETIISIRPVVNGKPLSKTVIVRVKTIG